MNLLELRCLKEHQTRGKRLLISLREVEAFEQILTTKNLVKKSISELNEDVCSDQTKAVVLDLFKKQLNKIAGDLEYCSLESNVKEVAAVVAG